MRLSVFQDKKAWPCTDQYEMARFIAGELPVIKNDLLNCQTGNVWRWWTVSIKKGMPSSEMPWRMFLYSPFLRSWFCAIL
jgi:hypothetical protein